MSYTPVDLPDMSHAPVGANEWYHSLQLKVVSGLPGDALKDTIAGAVDMRLSTNPQYGNDLAKRNE